MAFNLELDEANVPFVQVGPYRLRLALEELNDEERIRAAKELRETPENVEEGLRKLRELIKNEPNFDVPLEDDAFLYKFLRPCRFFPERAFKIMRKFYKFKLKHPKYAKNITPANVRHVYESEVFQVLPTRSSTNGRLIVLNIGSRWNPKEVSLEDLFRAVIAGIEIAMLEPITQLGGVHVILDMRGLSLNHVYQFSPQIAKLILDWVQECAPVRLRGIHIINQPYVFNMLYAIFKPFLGERLKRLVFFHGTDMAGLVERVSEGSLPPRYGGTAEYPECPGAFLADIMACYEKDFEVMGTYGYTTKEKV